MSRLLALALQGIALRAVLGVVRARQQRAQSRTSRGAPDGADATGAAECGRQRPGARCAIPTLRHRRSTGMANARRSPEGQRRWPARCRDGARNSAPSAALAGSVHCRHQAPTTRRRIADRSRAAASRDPSRMRRAFANRVVAINPGQPFAPRPSPRGDGTPPPITGAIVPEIRDRAKSSSR